MIDRVDESARAVLSRLQRVFSARRERDDDADARAYDKGEQHAQNFGQPSPMGFAAFQEKVARHRDKVAERDDGDPGVAQNLPCPLPQMPSAPPAPHGLPRPRRNGCPICTASVIPAPAAKPSASLPQESLRLSATRGRGAALSLPLPVMIKHVDAIPCLSRLFVPSTRQCAEIDHSVSRR